MTHNSDGEETRPYVGGHLPPSGGAPPSGPPATPWSPPAPAGWQPPPTGLPPAPAPPQRSGPGRAIAVIAVLAVIGVIAGGMWMYRSKFAGAQQSSEASASPSAESDPPPTSGATPTTTSTTTTAAPASPAAAPVSSAELANYLPNAEKLQTLLLTEPLTRTADAETTYTTVTTDRTDCGGAPNVALPTAYDRSGYTAIRTQEFFTEPGPNGQDSVTQAVAAFPSEQKAKDFVALEASRWGNCKFELVTIMNPGGDAIVRRMSSPRTQNGVLTLSIHSQMQSKLGCQRGLSSRSNIVIDVQICSRAGSAQAAELVSTIADRIPTN